MKRFFLTFIMFFLFVLCGFSLFAIDVSVQYELWLERSYELECSFYIASVTGMHFQDPPSDNAGNETTISMDEAFDTPQLYVAFRNNLDNATGYKIKVTFNQFRSNSNNSFRGSYIACMCRFNTTTINNDYVYYASDNEVSSFDIRTNANMYLDKNHTWNKAVDVNADKRSIEWGANATNRGSKISTWYYALAFMFEGNCPSFKNNVNYKNAYLTQGGTFTATITVELKTP